MKNEFTFDEIDSMYSEIVITFELNPVKIDSILMVVSNIEFSVRVISILSEIRMFLSVA